MTNLKTLNKNININIIYKYEMLAFKQQNTLYERVNFSSNVRKKGIGHVPIVIDSHDKEISEMLGGGEDGRRFCIRGTSKEYHMDYNIQHVLQDAQQILSVNEKKKQSFKLQAYVKGKYCYENELLGDLYKQYRDTDDNILYIEITKTVGVLDMCLDFVLDKIRSFNS